MGFLLVGIVFIYAVITLIIIIVVAKINKEKKQKWIAVGTVLVISILIPTWDIPIGRINFNSLCNNEAGQFIYKQIPLGEEYFLKEGERNTRYDNPMAPAYIAKGGELNLERIKQDYLIKTVFDKKYSRWGYIYKRETTVSTMNYDEIFSRSISFYFRGGWFFQVFMDGRAGQNVCPDNALPSSKEYIHMTLVDKTFQPKIY
jgi:hypothetical protein